MAAAADRGFKGFPRDVPVSLFNNASGATSGVINLTRVRLEASGTISSVFILLTTAGSGLSNCYIGIYSLAGALLGSSTDQSASWATAGGKTVALQAATTAQAAGTDVYVAILYNGSGLALRCASGLTSINLGASVCMATATGQTSLPSTLPSLSTSTTVNLAMVN